MSRMKVQLRIDAAIPLSQCVTDITFARKVMVSLDCCACKRCDRSAVLGRYHWDSYCTPDRHKFHGTILDLKSAKDNTSNIVTGSYLIEYEFEEFVDAKYPDRVPSPGSTWARVEYTMRCKCGANIWRETQNNQVRPLDVTCECGTVLVTETEENPRIEIVG